MSKWFSECTDSEKVDIYVTHSTPNIFLWISLFSIATPTSYAIFWANIFFFVGIFVDECQFIQSFSYAFNRRHKLAMAQAGQREETRPVPLHHPGLVPIPRERILPNLPQIL